MPGTAVLGSGVIDSLVVGLDQVRSALETAIGNRPWRVYRVIRTWTGPRKGAGTKADAEVEITPRPVVDVKAIRRDLKTAGGQDEGHASLREVSLTYTDRDASGGVVGFLRPTLTAMQEVYYRCDDASGRGPVGQTVR